MTVLNAFLLNPTPFNASRLISIPSLYHVLKIEHPGEGAYAWQILSLARWIHSRVRQVLQHLVDRGAKLSADPGMVGEKDKWQEVSAHVGRSRMVAQAKVRLGPFTAYPKYGPGRSTRASDMSKNLVTVEVNVQNTITNTGKTDLQEG